MSIKVVSFFGEGEALGDIVAEAGMQTQEGLLTRVSGSLCYVGSGSTESAHWQYDYYLQVASGQMYQQFSWPTGVNCEVYDRHTLFPNNTDFIFNENSTSGHTYLPHGTTPVTFAR